MTTLIHISTLPLVHALGWTLLHLCWQGTLVATALWCVLSLLDRRSSQTRYTAACLALGLMIAQDWQRNNQQPPTVGTDAGSLQRTVQESLESVTRPGPPE